MDVRVTEEPIVRLAAHAEIPIAFRVEHVLAVTVLADGLGGLELHEEPVAQPWTKDYDALEAPTQWASRYDVSGWGLLAAHHGDRRVGGAVVAHGSAHPELLDERADVAVLWDLRVAPEVRGRGVGTALVRAAESWCAARHVVALAVETQNVNVPACRCYSRLGYALTAIDRRAYPDLPGECRLTWTKDLLRRAT